MLKLHRKNYRCFEDQSPLSIDIRPGFTALVGPNNAGKSSFLKFFLEFRTFWGWFGNSQILQSWINGPAEPELKAVGEALEVFCDRNFRTMEIELEFPRSSGNELKRALLAANRPEPRRTPKWRLDLIYGPDGRRAEPRFTGRSGTTFSSANDNVDCQPLIDVAEVLSNCMYVGPFRNAITEGAGKYYDLSIGTAFINAWHDWKTGRFRSSNVAAERVEADIQNIFGFDHFEINAAEENTALQIRIDRKPYKLREVGAGIAQFIVTFATAAISKPSYILIDEPELNLHPSLQVDFLTSLTSYASRGVLFATHSLGLARSTADHIYSFTRNDGRSVVRPFEATVHYSEFAGEMSFAGMRELGFETLVLVEGVTEIKTIQQLLRKLNKDHRVLLIPLGGSQMIRGDVDYELTELRRLSRRIVGIVDSERTCADGELDNQRQAFREMCSRLGVKLLITERRAIENYFSDRSVKATFGEKYRALGFYERLSDAELAWSKRDNWRLAREMNIEEFIDTDLGNFLRDLEN